MIRFRGGDGPSNHSAIIGAQVVLGFGGGYARPVIAGVLDFADCLSQTVLVPCSGQHSSSQQARAPRGRHCPLSCHVSSAWFRRLPVLCLTVARTGTTSALLSDPQSVAPSGRKSCQASSPSASRTRRLRSRCTALRSPWQPLTRSARPSAMGSWTRTSTRNGCCASLASACVCRCSGLRCCCATRASWTSRRRWMRSQWPRQMLRV
jgi:hypothetical protein